MLGLGLRLWLGLEYHNPNPNSDPTNISAAERRPQQNFFRGNLGVREVFVGRHFSSELFRQFAADPPVSVQTPPESAGRSADLRQSAPENIFGGHPADPRRTGRSPRGFARIRVGRSSAEPIAQINIGLQINTG